MTDTVISSSKQLAKLTPITKIKISKDLLKMEKVVDACDKTLDQAWYTKGMAMLKIRESGKYTERYSTFEEYLDKRFHIVRRYGYRMMDSTVFIQKLIANNVAENEKIGHKEEPVLPTNEWQIRPLVEKLKHDGERIHVWQEVVQAGP